MKTTKTLIVALAFLAFGFNANAQMDDCNATVSLFAAPAQAKNYDEALKNYDKVIKECPSTSLATYQLAERMFKHFIKNGDNTKITDLIKSYELRLQYFPEDTKEGDVLGDIAQLKYDNKMCPTQELFEAFDKAEKTDPDNFTSPKSILTYFNLAIQLQDEGKMDLQNIFELYDALTEKIEGKESDMAKILAPLMEKQENGEALDSKEQARVNVAESNIENYGKVKSSLNGLLGQRADCDKLIPLYQSQFEVKKDDINWLRIAAGKLSGKDCDTPLFFQMVQQLHRLQPSAKSAYYLGRLADKDGKGSKALEYYNQAADLETNNNDKAKIYYSIAENFRKKGSFGQARSYYNRMVEVKPSAGIAYYKIAQMIGSSANSCGSTPFEKRAVNWKAAEYADRAARVDASLAGDARAAASSYRQRAPSKGDIFNSGKAGQTVTFNCWVGGSVRVPNL
jgi:tetratricopeptide (TPR) repeat protein